MELQKKKYSDGMWWTLRLRVKHAERDDSNQVTIKNSYRRFKVKLAGREKNPTQDVLDAAKAIAQKHNRKEVKAENVLKLGDFVEQVYLPECKKKKRHSTYYGYHRIWKSYLKSRCAEWWLREIKTHKLRTLLDTILMEHGLSVTSMHHLKAFLSGVFTYAIEGGYYEGVHPLARIRLTFPEAKEAAGDDDLPAYTQEQINEMLALVPEPAGTAIAVAAYTGLRRGEIVGLMWENVHSAVNGGMASIFVGRSIWNGNIGEPKTPESKAAVPLIKPLAERLEMFRMLQGNATSGPIFRQPAQKIINGVAWHPLDFDNLTSRLIVPSLEWCKLCGTRHIDHDDKKLNHEFELDESRILWRGWHGFRRGLATNLHRMGVQDKVIQKILRHKNVKTTRDMYIRPNQSDKEAGMKVLETTLDAPQMHPKSSRYVA